ncbi:MAG: NAD(P)-dependent oxidoreductase, partial [Candidatus Bathyarchaeia archaeon]
MQTLTNEIVLITGASSGIGAACARVCSKNG